MSNALVPTEGLPRGGSMVEVVSSRQAQEVQAMIRGQVAALYKKQVADALRILYGGSVKPENIRALMAMSDIDGALVGGASLAVESFASIVHFA